MTLSVPLSAREYGHQFYAGANISQTQGKGIELEKSLLKNSSQICTDFDKVALEATEGVTEAVTEPLQKYVNLVCSEIYKNQNQQEESIPG